jgi:uncharacterized membrane protein YgaE (UPF0421/DUF939 family)
LLVAHLFRLPEAYWSPISTLVIMQSTLGASLPVSAQRFAGTAFGAIVGGLIGSYFPGNVPAFGVCVLLIGLVCAAFNVQRAAYRFANITLSLVILIPRPHYQWTIAMHRFIEVSIGIAVGLAISAVWPEPKSAAPTVAPTRALPASPALAGVREQSGTMKKDMRSPKALSEAVIVRGRHR